MALTLITGVNIGLTIANVLIALFNLWLYRERLRTGVDRHEHWGRQ